MQKNIHEIRNGQALVEYALLIGGIALIIILTLSITGVSIRDIFCQVAGAIGSDACGQNCTLSFDDPSELDDWISQDAKLGYLTIENGQMCDSGSLGNLFAACAEGGLDGPGYSDFTITFDGININNKNNGLNAGLDLFFRMDKSGRNGYWFTYIPGRAVWFWKMVDGRLIPLKAAGVPSEWANEAELNFDIKAEGNTLSAYKDGQLILETNDDTFDSGIFGWRNKPGSTTCLGSIVVQ